MTDTPSASEPFLAALAPSSPAAMIAAELNHVTEFTITGEHLMLLARLNIGWLDYGHDEHGPLGWGAPAVSANRPYGNSDMFSDIGEILDQDRWHAAYCGEGDEQWDAYVATNEARFTRLHAETMIALRIILQTGQYRTGPFIRVPRCGPDMVDLNAPWRPGPDPALDQRPADD